MIKYHYFGDTSKAYTNVITVASELDKRMTSAGEATVVKIGFSLSNEKDLYKKRIGKQIATNRFNSDYSHTLFIKGEVTFNNIIKTIAEFLLKDEELPLWVAPTLQKYI